MAKRVAMIRSKSVGGVEPRLDRGARALAAAGHDVHVVLWDRDLDHPAAERREGYAVHRIRYRAPYNRPSLAWKLPRFWSKSFRLLERLRPDIVHSADYDTVPPALRARRRWGAKFVFDVWDFYADMMTSNVPETVRRIVRKREAEAIREADLVILPDLASRARLSTEPRRLIEVMNVPEEQNVTRSPHDRFTVFYGGNIAKDRGLPGLVRACEATGAVLIVAGRGPDEAELLPLIESSPNAVFLGHVSHDEIVRQTASADVIPALYDPSVPINRLASPNKLYEAMMCGVPTLVADGTRMADIVRSERVGVVVPYGDNGAIRRALETLMLSPDGCAELGSRGRRLYEERFRWGIMRERLTAAYRDL